jgi:hypothetical protein
MQKKRTFMTAPDMVILDDEDSDKEEKNKPIIIPMESKQDIFDEYTTMLKDIVDT